MHADLSPKFSRSGRKPDPSPILPPNAAVVDSTPILLIFSIRRCMTDYKLFLPFNSIFSCTFRYSLVPWGTSHIPLNHHHYPLPKHEARMHLHSLIKSHLLIQKPRPACNMGKRSTNPKICSTFNSCSLPEPLSSHEPKHQHQQHQYHTPTSPYVLPSPFIQMIFSPSNFVTTDPAAISNIIASGISWVNSKSRLVYHFRVRSNVKK